MKRISYILLMLLFVGMSAFLTSCFSDLDVVPLDDDEVTAATVYDDPGAYRQVLAKLYAGLSLSGQQGPAGQPDISGIDEGFSTYIRQYWKAQELTTDEAVIAWNDGNIQDYHQQDWDAQNEFIAAMYNRIFYQISLVNEFIRESTDEKVTERGIDAAGQAEIQIYRAEARFLRALSYYHALDMFRNVPFVTEDDKVGSFFPNQTNAADLFTYIESELKAVEGLMADPLSNEYGRADKAAAWMTLAKLYLNAEVYIGQDKNSDCVEYSKKVIDAGFVLDAEYANIFTADNHLSPEIIFPVVFDGINAKTYGGMTFVTHAAVGGSMNAGDFGLDGGWGGTRVTRAIVDKFPAAGDGRAMFYTDGQNLEIGDIAIFTEGYAVTKFTNVTSEGIPGSDLEFADTDFPMYRLADAYLMYAEAVLRGGGGGDLASAVGYMNDLQERAYGGSDGNITEADLTLDWIIDERARELMWECHRRTDLVRFGQYAETNYLWPWKGGVPEGVSTSAFYDVFPIPSTDIGANPNLIQNTGY